ncbi:hypothetical protein BpHYR1_014287 [Brachionus plicatilis]|uniref:Uncharacterized protein n=1 Tax=Brachionus plicatilis TaxID=10195 RepID=A0A3M7R6J2_BRAPC|nr:hypothetical protein BpHYR1_014287 [Brachionus plicatilis]
MDILYKLLNSSGRKEEKSFISINYFSVLTLKSKNWLKEPYSKKNLPFNNIFVAVYVYYKD